MVRPGLALSLLLCCAPLLAQQNSRPPALTIYNGDFAVVHQTVPLELKAGVNQVHFDDATAQVEPDSVVLRDPRHDSGLQILEQNYRNDPVSQELLLSLFEGQTINFASQRGDKQVTVPGKIIRSGYVPNGESVQPIIEVDGKLQFSLPGEPRFPALASDTVLKPVLTWKLQSDRPGHTDAELSYITGGMSWEAAYNVVAPPQGDVLEITGWITLNNHSGKMFDDARIKLVAGDVHKLPPSVQYDSLARVAKVKASEQAPPPVQEKSFDEFHLYTLQNSTTLHDEETKQVEFIRADGVRSQRLYIYDGAAEASMSEGDSPEESVDFGTQSSKKIAVYQEFKNSKENHLGMPLPKGRIRFYRRDVAANGREGHSEFTGENTIDHTPTDENVRIYTGNAFDLVGERKQTSFVNDNVHHHIDESYEITLRNHKKQAVQIRVVEHLYRWTNWRLIRYSLPFKKKDAQTVEFLVNVPAAGTSTVTYKVRYSWQRSKEE